ncbi:MAG: replication protein [Bacteroidales bacterium]|nr:replication protein [Bacteroidales bacterium]
MPNPQIENGHLDLANEIVDRFCLLNLSACEWRVLWAILRKTYCWHKKTDRITYSQFERMTDLNRWHIQRYLNRLIERKIIIKIGTGQHLEYGLQKDYSKWQPLPKEATKHHSLSKPLPKQATVTTITQTGYGLLPKQVTKPLPKQVTTKENKETIQKKGDFSFLNDQSKQIFVGISFNFHCKQKEFGLSHSDFKKTLTRKSRVVVEGGKILEKIHRIDGESLEDIKQVLDFIIADDNGQIGTGWHGWRRNVVSLASLRSKNNGEMKYFKIKNRMPRSQGIQF